MPTESLIFVVLVVCAFLLFMAVLAYMQRTAYGQPIPTGNEKHDDARS